MSDLLQRITAQPFFKGLKAEHLKSLADDAMQAQFALGQIIFREGDPANRFYLIERGRVAVELEPRDHEPIVVDVLGPGRELGWAWILPPYYENFVARALEPTDAIFFYGSWLRERCQENHDLGYEMMTRMAVVMLHRIQAASQRLLEGHA